MKRIVIIILALVLLIPMVLVAAAPVSANVLGKSPGYWKNTQQHVWPDPYAPTIRTARALAVYNTSILPGGANITLLETLQAGGGGKIAFMRQAVAQLLNMRAAGKDLPADDPTGYIAWLQALVNAVLSDADGQNISFQFDSGSGPETYGPKSLEEWKNYLESYNQ